MLSNLLTSKCPDLDSQPDRGHRSDIKLTGFTGKCIGDDMTAANIVGDDAYNVFPKRWAVAQPGQGLGCRAVQGDNKTHRAVVQTGPARWTGH